MSRDNSVFSKYESNIVLYMYNNQAFHDIMFNVARPEGIMSFWIKS